MISDETLKTEKQPVSPAKPRRIRPFLLAGLSFLALIGCLGGLAATLFFDLLNNYGVSYGRDLPRIPYTSSADLGVNPLGVNTSLHLETDTANIDRSLDMIKVGGFGFIRQIFPWEAIEPERGQYDWAKFDQIVEKAAARNIQIIARLDRPPYWARAKEYDRLKSSRPDAFNSLTGPPENYDDFAAFVGQFASRYKNRLRFYQIWNEPNLAAEWNDRRVNPAEYTDLLKQAYTRLKEVNPNALVLAASLAPTVEDGPEYNNLSELKYLDQMYKAGAKSYFDVLGVQMYGLGYSPDFRLLQPDFRSKDWKRVNLNRVAASHEIMEKNGDKAKSVWATEYGWIAVPPGPYLDDYNNPKQPGRIGQQWGDSITEQQQAEYLTGGLERARQEWPWLGVVSVWFFRPDPPLASRPQDPTNYFALVWPDFKPRPAFTALKNYSANEYTTMATGWHPANDPALNYSGPIATLTEGSSFTSSFRGERIEIVLTPSRDGKLQVSVDGGESKEISFKAGGETRLTLAEGLKDIKHTLRVKVVGTGSGSNTLAQVSGFYVSRDNHFGWLVVLLYGGLSVGAVGSAGVFARQFWIIVPPLIARMVGWLWRSRESYAPYVMLVALAIYYFAPSMPLAIAGALLFFPMALVRPDWAVLYAVMFAPLYLHPRDLKLSQSPLETLKNVLRPYDPHDTRPRLEFSLTEIIIVMSTGAWLVRAIFQKLKFSRKTTTQTSIPIWDDVPTLDNRKSEPSIKYQVSSIKNKSELGSRKSKILPDNRQPFFQLATRNSQLLSLALFIFFVAACLSLLTPEPSHLKEALREFRLVIVEPLLLFLLAGQFLKGQNGVKRAFDVLIGVGVVVALIGIGQFVFRADKVVLAEGVSRVVSVYNHPDNLGLFLGRVIPLATGYTLFSGGKWERRRWLYLTALAPLGLALALSFSRGAWLGTGLALLVMIIAAGSRRGLMVYGAGLLLVIAAIPFVKIERITSLFSFDGGSNSTRLHVWQASVQMLRDYPLTGIGLDQFLYKYSVQYVSPEAWLERFTSHPHNLLLDYWLRLGIMGPPILLALLIVFFSIALKIISSDKKLLAPQSQEKLYNGNKNRGWSLSERGVLTLGLLGSMTDFVVHGLVDNSYFLVDLAVVFCLSFALLKLLQYDAKVTKGEK